MPGGASFKQTNLVAGFRGRDREPDGERTLAGAALARDQSDCVHGAFAHSRVLPRNAKTHDKSDAKRPRIPAECLQTFTHGYPGKQYRCQSSISASAKAGIRAMRVSVPGLDFHREQTDRMHESSARLILGHQIRPPGCEPLS